MNKVKWLNTYDIFASYVGNKTRTIINHLITYSVQITWKKYLGEKM